MQRLSEGGEVERVVAGGGRGVAATGEGRGRGGGFGLFENGGSAGEVGGEREEGGWSGLEEESGLECWISPIGWDTMEIEVYRILLR